MDVTRAVGSAHHAAPDHGVNLDFHGRLPSEEIHKHHHSLLAWHDLRNDGFQAMEDSAGNTNLVPGGDFTLLPGDDVRIAVQHLGELQNFVGA